MTTLPSFATASLLSLCLIAPGIQSAQAATPADSLVTPQTLIVAPDLSAAQRDAQILAARRYGSFWDTGDASLARAALAPGFIDRTLPAGRAQGTEGPLAASQGFRTAVPDLHCEITQMIVAADRVVAHLHFTGHFSGHFGATQGTGQAVDFIATDIYRITNGRIQENWHIEDNLTLFRQMGLAQ